MTSLTRQLYLFLAACGSNWRNTIFVTSRREPSHPGYLLAADHDGSPVIIKAADFHYMTGVWIDPAECCGQISEASFEAMYAQYLLWHTPFAEGNPLQTLSQEPPMN